MLRLDAVNHLLAASSEQKVVKSAGEFGIHGLVSVCQPWAGVCRVFIFVKSH